jgi:hypothetical protein
MTDSAEFTAKTGLPQEAHMCIQAMWVLVDPNKKVDSEAMDLLAYLIGTLFGMLAKEDWKKQGLAGAVQSSFEIVRGRDAALDEQRAAIFLAAVEKSARGSQ